MKRFWGAWQDSSREIEKNMWIDEDPVKKTYNTEEPFQSQ